MVANIYIRWLKRHEETFHTFTVFANSEQDTPTYLRKCGWGRFGDDMYRVALLILFGPVSSWSERGTTSPLFLHSDIPGSPRHPHLA